MHDETNQIYPSFFLGVIQSVNTVSHTVDILPYGMVEALKDVPIMTDPSNITLPEEQDIAIVIFDNRLRPMVIGFYQAFIRDGSDPSVGQYYSMQPGDIIINSTSDIGGRLMMLQTGVMKFVSARHGQGIEIDPSSGTFVTRSSSEKDVCNGAVERLGWIRRKNVVNLFDVTSLLDLDSLESVIQKVGTISAPGAIVFDTPGGIEMYEKKTEIKVPGSQTANNPQGVNLIEETLGTGVIPNDPVGQAYTETMSSQSGLPLRKKTVYYDPTGTTELLTEEIDAQGNLKIFMSASALAGIEMTTTAGTVKLNGTLINLNGSGDSVVLGSLLSTFFNSHTHLYAPGPGTPVPTAPPTVLMTPAGTEVSSLTVKAT